MKQSLCQFRMISGQILAEGHQSAIRSTSVPSTVILDAHTSLCRVWVRVGERPDAPEKRSPCMSSRFFRQQPGLNIFHL